LLKILNLAADELPGTAFLPTFRRFIALLLLPLTPPNEIAAQANCRNTNWLTYPEKATQNKAIERPLLSQRPIGWDKSTTMRHLYNRSIAPTSRLRKKRLFKFMSRRFFPGKHIAT
jgi:hypothetical protein